MNNPNILVSVLMPVYNQSTFVRCALQSLLCQTYTAWELLIVDDGSTDGLHDTVFSLPVDSRIRYLRNEENRGMGFSLNRGLNAAKGSLIAYLPADDPQQRKPDITLAHGELDGWQPTIPLEEGLKRTIAYFKNLIKETQP